MKGNLTLYIHLETRKKKGIRLETNSVSVLGNVQPHFITRLFFYYRTTLNLWEKEEGECTLGEAVWRGFWTRKHGSVTGAERPRRN